MKWTLALLLIAAVGSEGLAVYVGWNLTHPARKAVTVAPDKLGLTFEPVTFQSREDGLRIDGWFLPASGAPSDRTVILAHGFRGNRQDTGPGLLTVAKVLVENGYNALLFDFRASGSSAGDEVTVGWKETRDLAGAVDYVRSRGARKVALVGFSMGAATSLMTAAELPEVDAVVADSSFGALGPYLLENARHWTKLPDFPFTYLIYATVPRMLGVSLDGVSPIKAMGALADRPVLLIHGTGDTAIDVHHSKDLFAAYQAHGGKQGELVLVPGAGHTGSYKAATDLYKEKLLGFLGQHLR
ncbi:MAG TPA: alpha/beta fold hydrolase [Symbiobacteriaceae bacterium]|nr:alpha/beta fold hydrolase [Symbiobacteriaceae bacterium]